MSQHTNIKAPTPLRNKLLSALSTSNAGLSRSISSTGIAALSRESPLNSSRTPDPRSKPTMDKEQELLNERLNRYNLDYPRNYEQYLENALDENSRWFSRKTKRKLDLIKLLPYSTETHLDHAKYLSHILVHLYIAIKSMDLEGLISVSTKDLAAIRNDIELTLDTDFFNADLKFDVENDEDDDLGDEEDEEVKSSGIIGKVMPKSATVISVNHWTNELKSCLKMKVDLPLTLRASLANVYYHLVLATGQVIQDNLFITMFIKLTLNYKPLLRENKRLVLDHKPLLTFFSQFFPTPNPSFDTYSPNSCASDKKLFDLYLKLASNANPYFSDDSLQEIYDWSLERFSPYTASLSASVLMNCLPIAFTESKSVLMYLPSIFHLLTNNSLNNSLDMSLIELLGRISKGVYEKILNKELDISIYRDFGIFTENQFNFILNKVQVNLRLEQKINSFQGISNVLIYSLAAQNFDKTLEKVSGLLSSLETFAHPSNIGPWTHLVARFTQKVLARYHSRFINEQKEETPVSTDLKLTTGMNSKVFYAFRDIVLLGSQSKKENSSVFFVASIGYLCDLPSSARHELINQILLDLYDSLTGQYINSNHRLIVSLKQFTEISRFMISDELYRVHITHILSLLMNKIGTNDLSLTNSVFNAIVTVISFIQLHDFSTPDDFISFESDTLFFIQEHIEFIKQNPKSKFEPDKEVLKKAFIASTKIFKDLVKTLVDRYILLLEADINEKLLFKFSQTLLILVESLSEDIFRYMVKLVKENLMSDDLNNENENEPLMANLVASVIKRDPSLAKEFFGILDRMIRYEIDQAGAGTIRNKTNKVLGGDKRLVLYLTIISEVLSVSVGEVLNFKKEYLDMISYIYEKLTNPSLIGPATYVIHKTLKNLTSVKLKENRVFQSEPDPSDIESRWGLHQFDEVEKFESKNLDFEWFVPSNKEISCAIEIFELVVFKTLTNIDTLIGTGNLSDLNSSDQLGKSLLYLSHSLSGLSILFDPEFNSEGLDEELNKTSLQKRLMILKSLRESKSEDNELNIDIEEITKNDNNVELSGVPSPSKDLNSDDGAVKLDSSKEVNDSSTDQVMDTDDERSMSSRTITPSIPHESDLTSVMNPAIAFREATLYNCNYFFGQTQAEKRYNSNYGHIHSLKTLIGHSLHKLAIVIFESNDDNLNLTQLLLLTIRTYFCDVGKESSFDVDDQLFIDYTFLKKVQSLVHRSKPFTRTALGARLEKFHRQRVILHSTNRFQSKLDKILLKDLVKFSTSSFSSVYQPAHIVLIETMKKLIGSYGLIMNELLASLEDSVKKNDFKRLESGLRVLRLKKVSRKITHDYTNIKRIVEILGSCLKLKDHDINGIAQNCFNDMCTSVQVPSAVVLFDESQIDKELRPRDKHIDLEISTVRSAKDIKRNKYIRNLLELQDFLISEESKVDHWKLSLFYLKFVINLQEYYEFPTKTNVLEILIERSKTSHPSLVRLCIKSFSSLVAKILAFASFEHNLKNSFTINYPRDELVQIDSIAMNFTEEFAKETCNYKDPRYFIDGRFYHGYLFWGSKLEALKSKDIDLKLDAGDKQTLKSIGSLLTKNLLKQIFEVLAQENETSGNFQESEVSLITATVKLISLDASNIKYQEILDLITEIYNKDEEAAVIVTAEIVSGLLQGTAFTSSEHIKLRDEFLEVFFQKALLSELTPESTSVWKVVFWLVPSKIDFKRIPVLVKQIESIGSIVNVDSNLAYAQSSRIGFARSFLASANYRYNNAGMLLNEITFTHPYELVRFSIGGLFSNITMTSIKENYENSSVFLQSQNGNDLGTVAFNYSDSYSQKIFEIFTKANEENTKIQGLNVQDALKSDYYYLASTILYWLSDALCSPYSPGLIRFIKDYISPFLMQLENNRELCKLGNMTPIHSYRRLGQILCRQDQIPELLSIITVQHVKIHQILMQLSFTEVFYSRNLMLLSLEQKELLLERIDELLFHSSVEIRTRASAVLSGIIHNSQDLKATEKFIKKYNEILSKNKKTKGFSNEQIIKLHGSALGVGALISAFPYVSPPPKWLPEQIVVLARVSSISGIVGKVAKDALSNFKKLRADTWHIDRSYFTEEQLEDLEGVLWRSYFA